MPIYVYEIINVEQPAGSVSQDGTVSQDETQSCEQFEVVQKMGDPPLTVHPETGQPVRRVIQPPFIGGTWSDHAMKKSTSDDKKLDRLGFTKYVKAGDGFYEKRAGKGPNLISADNPIKPSDLKR